MSKYHIDLTEGEKQILTQIDLRDSHRTHDEGHAAFNANKAPVLMLLRSLTERSAIPHERVKYWNDPAYFTGGLKASHRQVFERNGCRGEEIYTHPHFIPFLRYFLFGAELPDTVVSQFEEKVGNPDWVTSSDVVPIGKFARQLARQHALDSRRAPEEFFKLCLDMRLGLSRAESVRRSVMQARYS